MTKHIEDLILWYTNPANFQDGIAGAPSLFGWEPELGKRAQEAIAHIRQLNSRLEKLQAKLEKLEAERKPQVISQGQIELDLFGHTWICSNLEMLCRFAWENYCEFGKGTILVGHGWRPEGFSMRTVYVPGLSNPLSEDHAQMLREYDPQHELIIAMQGYGIDKSYMRVQRVSSGEVPIPEIAKQVGFCQPAVTSSRRLP